MKPSMRQKIIEESVRAIQDVDQGFTVSDSELAEAINSLDPDTEQIIEMAELAIKNAETKIRTHQERDTLVFVHESMEEFAEQNDIEEYDSLASVFVDFQDYMRSKVHGEIQSLCREEGIERVKELYDCSNEDLKEMGVEPDEVEDFSEVLREWGDDD